LSGQEVYGFQDKRMSLIDRSRVRAIIFDVDGTLRDTDDQLVRRLASLLYPIRFVFQNKDPGPFARRTVMALEDPGTFIYSLPDRLNIDHYLARVGDTLYRLGIGRDSGHYLLVEGVKPLIVELKKQYPLAIVSARGRRSTMAFLNHFELTPFFDCIATSQTCRYTKPYPDPILWVADRLKLPPASCLMVGDTTVDILAGKTAGAQTVGVLCGFGEEDELRRAGADLILPNTHELSGFLLGN
jgi:phosphoglycolate phosphatase